MWKITQQIADLEADEDGDGLNNLLEYALKKNPHVPDALGAIQTDRKEIDGAAFLTLTYRRPYDEWAAAPEGADAGYDGIGYTVETSTDLMTWQSGPDYVDQSVIPETNGSMATVEARVAVDSPKKFLRLRVHLP